MVHIFNYGIHYVEIQQSLRLRNPMMLEKSLVSALDAEAAKQASNSHPQYPIRLYSGKKVTSPIDVLAIEKFLELLEILKNLIVSKEQLNLC